MATETSSFDFATITILYLGGFFIIYRLACALYNISPFHPLYRFPGPKIAAVSYLYEAYYDWILKGRYGKVINQMHKTYGTSCATQISFPCVNRIVAIIAATFRMR